MTRTASSAVVSPEIISRLAETERFWLKAAALSPFVVYERLDADRYSLQVIYPPHDATVERNVANIAPPRNLESLLNL